MAYRLRSRLSEAFRAPILPASIRPARFGLPCYALGMALLASLSCGCKADREARVNVSSYTPIALGAYYSLYVDDACTADPKLPICSTEQMALLDAIEVDDWSIAQIVRMGEIPEGLRVEGAPLALYGAGAGATEIHIEATFDDGSERDVDQSVVVEPVTDLEITHRCPLLDFEDETLVPAGGSLTLDVVLMHDDHELYGEHPLPLTGEGLTRLDGGLGSHQYTWTGPDGSGQIELRSPIVRDFSDRLQHYDATELQLDALEPTRDLGEKLAYDAYIGLDATISVGEVRPCASFDLEFETRTPELCVGPEGAESWSVNPSSTIALSARGTGRCELAVRVAGTEEWQDFEYELEVGEPPADTLPCADVVCEVPEDPCAQGSRLGRTEDGCCDACFPEPDPELCEEERAEWDAVYEAEIASATSCVFDADCTVTVLVAGCRDYCYVPLSNQGITPFMSAVSELYYTGCPHCAVAEPPACQSPTTVYCDGGQCLLAP